MGVSKKIIYWSPRVLSISFVLFLSLFSLDIFNEHAGWNIIMPLLVHLIPALLLLVAVLIAWKYDLVGALVFVGFAIWYTWSAGFDRPVSWYLSIAAPAAIVGVLFLASWYQKRKLRSQAR
jgi:hypothetical protein